MYLLYSYNECPICNTMYRNNENVFCTNMDTLYTKVVSMI